MFAACRRTSDICRAVLKVSQTERVRLQSQNLRRLRALETQPDQPAHLVNQRLRLNPLLRVCSLLNKEGVRYLVAGGQAAILHGVLRTTQDVGILIEATEENCQKVITALSRLEDGAAKELVPRDL